MVAQPQPDTGKTATKPVLARKWARRLRLQPSVAAATFFGCGLTRCFSARRNHFLLDFASKRAEYLAVTWDNDFTYRRVDETDVPSQLLELLESSPITSVTLHAEKNERSSGGRKPFPAVGTYTPDPEESPLDVARAVAGYALAKAQQGGGRFTGRFRARLKGSASRKSKDFHADDIGRSFEDDADSSASGAAPAGDCAGCSALKEVVTVLQLEASQLREMLAAGYDRAGDRYDALLARSEERFDRLLERAEERVDKERNARDDVVGKMGKMAERVLDPSNDATARTLGMLDKGVELAVGAIEEHRAIAMATSAERDREARRETARQLVSGLEKVLGPLAAAGAAKLMGVSPTEMESMTQKNQAPDYYKALLAARKDLFEMATEENWNDARGLIGDDIVDQILALEHQDPLSVADTKAACDAVADLEQRVLLTLPSVIGIDLTNQLLAVSQLAEKAVQP